MPFERASVARSKLRLALAGPSGSGKTWTALSLATRLVAGLKERGTLEGNGLISLTDSEHGSSRKYAKAFQFDVQDLTSFSPDDYIRQIEEAERFGYTVHVIDSLSHEWSGKGGVLELHDRITQSTKSSNSFAAWGKVTPVHNALIDKIIRSNLHIICTMRSKVAYVQKDGAVSKVGMRPIQRKDTEYEFDVLSSMNQIRKADGGYITLRVDKSRCLSVPLGAYYEQRVGLVGPIDEVGSVLAGWLSEGEETTPTATATQEERGEGGRSGVAAAPQPQRSSTVLPAEDVAELVSLREELRECVLALGKTSEQFDATWRQALQKRHVTRIEDLNRDDALEMAGKVTRNIQELKLKLSVQQPQGQPTQPKTQPAQQAPESTPSIPIPAGPQSPQGSLPFQDRESQGQREPTNPQDVTPILNSIKAANPAERLPDGTLSPAFLPPPWVAEVEGEKKAREEREAMGAESEGPKKRGRPAKAK
jgi:hypothetical protein